MPIHVPLIPFIRRRRRRPSPAGEPVPPVALTLISASYDEGATTLTLTFDRAIDIAGIDGSFILLRDGSGAEMLYDASGEAVLTGPASVELTLVAVEGDSTPGVVLSVSPENGIVAVDDGGTWDGVAELALPYP